MWHQILPKYPEIERRLKEYIIEWMSEEPGMHYTTMVREFSANYSALLDNGPKSIKRILVRL